MYLDNVTMQNVMEGFIERGMEESGRKYRRKVTRALTQVLAEVKQYRVRDLTPADWMELAKVSLDINTWEKPALNALTGFVKFCQSCNLLDYAFATDLIQYLAKIGFSKPSPEKQARMKVLRRYPDGMSLILRNSLEEVPRLVFPYDCADYPNMDADVIYEYLEWDVLNEIKLNGFTARKWLNGLIGKAKYPLPQIPTSFQRLAVAMLQCENLRGVSNETRESLVEVAFSERNSQYDLKAMQECSAPDIFKELIRNYLRCDVYKNCPKKLTQRAATEAYWYLRLFLDVAIDLDFHSRNIFVEREMEDFNTVMGVQIWHNPPGAVF